LNRYMLSAVCLNVFSDLCFCCDDGTYDSSPFWRNGCSDPRRLVGPRLFIHARTPRPNLPGPASMSEPPIWRPSFGIVATTRRCLGFWFWPPPSPFDADDQATLSGRRGRGASLAAVVYWLTFGKLPSRNRPLEVCRRPSNLVKYPDIQSQYRLPSTGGPPEWNPVKTAARAPSESHYSPGSGRDAWRWSVRREAVADSRF